MNNNTEIKIKDFRAIHKADIVLNGITVIAGVNGSGKSSLSKMLYYAFDKANSMDSIYLSKLVSELRPITEIYQQLVSIYPDLGNIHSFFITLYKDIEKARNILEKALIGFKKKLISSPDNAEIVRLLNIIKYNIGRDIDAESLEETVLNVFDEQVGIYHYRIEQRPVTTMDAALSLEFDEKSLLDKVYISEYGVPFFGKDISKIPILHYIKNTTYIESPLSVKFDEMWGVEADNAVSKLYFKLFNSEVKEENVAIAKYIEEHIIDGNVALNNESEEIVYQRNDGETFSLQDCATGIKAFAILQLLLRNGYINDRSLIIIDEPEAHLHPQWIVEYAKLIVELNKQVGAKFFIATHSTDMVSALRYISEKEETLERLAFYNAVPAKQNPYKFNYEAMGTDIEPIFASFNKSFDLIEQYGADNGV